MKKTIGYMLLAVALTTIQSFLIWLGVDHGEWAPVGFEGFVAYIVATLWCLLS